MACHEQEPVLAEVEGACTIRAERINPLREKAAIEKYHLTVTPTIIILKDGVETRRFEGLVYREQLEEAIRQSL